MTSAGSVQCPERGESRVMDRARRTAAAAPHARAPFASREPTAQEFFARLASEEFLPTVRHGDSREAPELTSGDLAAVARLVAPLFGDRPLAGLTLGEIAQLPAILEARGMGASESRVACRALGTALRSAILDLPDHPPPAS